MSGCLMSTLPCKPHLLTKGMLFKNIVVIKGGGGGGGFGAQINLHPTARISQQNNKAFDAIRALAPHDSCL